MDINIIPVLSLVPIIIGVVAAVRKIGLPTRFAPIAAIVLGVAGISLVSDMSGLSILSGIVTGLASAGLYSSAKTTSGL